MPWTLEINGAGPHETTRLLLSHDGPTTTATRTRPRSPTRPSGGSPGCSPSSPRGGCSWMSPRPATGAPRTPSGRGRTAGGWCSTGRCRRGARKPSRLPGRPVAVTPAGETWRDVFMRTGSSDAATRAMRQSTDVERPRAARES